MQVRAERVDTQRASIEHCNAQRTSVKRREAVELIAGVITDKCED